MVALNLIVCSLATWQYYNWSYQQDMAHRKQLTAHILSQFKRYESILLGCNSFFNASNEVTNDEWDQFIEGLKINSKYPALIDLGVIRYKPTTLTSSDDNPAKANAPEDWSAKILKRYCFVLDDLEDIERFDTSALIREKLLESARDRKIVCMPTIANWLCAENSSTLMMPLYKEKNNSKNSDSAFDIDNLYGWVAIAMDLDKLIELNTINAVNGEIIKLTYVDSDLLANDHISLENLQKDMNGPQSKTTHHIAGGVWAVQITEQPSAQASIVFLLLSSILMAGLLISLLFSGLLGASISSHQHAMQMIAIKSKALIESEQRTREILDTANEAFLACNFTGHIVDWSKQAQRLFGYSKDQIIGRTLTQAILFDKQQVDATHGGLRQLLAGSSSGQRIELTAQNASGKTFPIEMSISPMQTNDGFIFNAFVHDITDRKMMQTQLSHVQKLESMGELAAGIAHEINTPTQYVGDNTRFLKDAFSELDQAQTAVSEYVNAIKNEESTQNPEFKHLLEVLDTLDLEFLHEEIPTAIEQTLDGISRVAEIVRSMKNFAHPGTENKQLCNLNQAIQSTTVVSRNVWKYVSDLKLDLAPDLPQVNCTPGEINQVVLNLIVNASHAIEDKQKALGDESKGLITIHTSQIGDKVKIQVTDSGNGIPSEIRDRIYDPFSTTKEVGRGTGQGLAIARTVIVDKHMGEISFETQDGEGTTFTIILPIDCETEVETEVDTEQEQQTVDQDQESH